jgi:DNA mismatch repair protein MutS
MNKPKVNNIKLTPMLKQYMDIKNEHPDRLLLFRMGDFYETFFDDAKILAESAKVTLTTRNKNSDHPVPLAGVPHHAIQTYLTRLLEAGHTVAICEQTEDPAHAKGLVKREVVEVISPGTATSDILVESNASNYCLSYHSGQNGIAGWAILDVSTGDFKCGQEHISLFALCERFNVREALIAETVDPETVSSWKQSLPETVLNCVSASWFHPSFSKSYLCEHFGILNLDPFDLEDDSNSLAVSSAGAVLKYFTSLSMRKPSQITTLSFTTKSDKLLLDEETLRNLEVFKTFRGEKGEGSVIHHIDFTQTPMGRRLLESRLAEPLTCLDLLSKWHNSVSDCKDNRNLRTSIRGLLMGIGDLQRLSAQTISGRIGPARLLQLGNSLKVFEELINVIDESFIGAINALSDLGSVPDLSKISTLILTSLSEDAPVLSKSGGYIASGINDKLDDYREIVSDTRGFLASLQQSERDKSGIPTLKVGFNKVFGYYLEVTNKHLDKVPEQYEQKQTLVNACRYHTPELKEAENRIVEAESQISLLESEIFSDLIKSVSASIPELTQVANFVASIDLVTAFAELSEIHNYCQPICDDSLVLDIQSGRHPVVEQLLQSEFIPNNSALNCDLKQLVLLTGPNMGGKSTYLRQNALIVLLAQTGSHVPADSARIGVADRIFTRVGSSDNVARGQSTFFSEMSESARILHLMTQRSLVVLDEVGRGTSTYDGLSLAWAITEFLHSDSSPSPRTIFATHYHELTELENSLSRLVNMQMDVKEWEGKIIFLHSVKPGCSDKSYGIHVAKLAGIPEPVLIRAEQILNNLSLEDQRALSGGNFNPSGFSIVADVSQQSHNQLSLFTDQERTALDNLHDLDLNKISPMDAFMWLAKIKKQLQ